MPLELRISLLPPALSCARMPGAAEWGLHRADRGCLGSPLSSPDLATQSRL